MSRNAKKSSGPHPTPANVNKISPRVVPRDTATEEFRHGLSCWTIDEIDTLTLGLAVVTELVQTLAARSMVSWVILAAMDVSATAIATFRCGLRLMTQCVPRFATGAFVSLSGLLIGLVACGHLLIHFLDAMLRIVVNSWLSTLTVLLMVLDAESHRDWIRAIEDRIRPAGRRRQEATCPTARSVFLPMTADPLRCLSLLVMTTSPGVLAPTVRVILEKLGLVLT